MDELDRLKEQLLGLLRHLTTLSLVSLGGILTFLGTILAELPTKQGIWIAAALFLFAGMTSLASQQRLASVSVRSHGQLEPSRRAARNATMSLLLGAGVSTGVMLGVVV
ncbi:MAG: hypothetical protein SNJ63_02895 [Sphingomonadaceae bacterium]